MRHVGKIGRVVGLASAAVSLVGTAACGASPDASFARTSSGAQCGPTLDFEPVNEAVDHRGWIAAREDGVALIDGACTGAFIGTVEDSGPLVITAGHCVGLGDRPTVVFNFEDNADGAQTVISGTVIEQSEDPDYALLELDGAPQVAPIPMGTRPTRTLTVVQHPRGLPKVVARGTFAFVEQWLIHYTDLDTLVGSSGAPIFNSNGLMIGHHTGGDCGDEGTNWGWQSTAIIRASPTLSEYVLDC